MDQWNLFSALHVRRSNILLYCIAKLYNDSVDIILEWWERDGRRRKKNSRICKCLQLLQMCLYRSRVLTEIKDVESNYGTFIKTESAWWNVNNKAELNGENQVTFYYKRKMSSNNAPKSLINSLHMECIYYKSVIHSLWLSQILEASFSCTGHTDNWWTYLIM